MLDILKVMSKRQVFDAKGSEVVMDIETYPNYLLICFEYADGGRVYFEGNNFNMVMLKWIIQNNTIITFNGIKFDMPLIYYMLHKGVLGFDEYEIYCLAQELISGGLYWTRLLKSNRIAWGDYGADHIDLIEPSFGDSSLKTYAGRLHSPYMQDLPYHHSTVLSEQEKIVVLNYCWNDTRNTWILRKALSKAIKLREEMGIRYDTDLRSKSDAQIAEAVISRELQWKYGIFAKRPTLDESYTFKYKTPENIKFKTESMQEVLKTVERSVFRLGDTNNVVMPREISSLKFHIHENYDSVYNMGIGGLHSTEKWMGYEHDDDYMIIDRDVASYYPRIILNLKLFPKQLTENFLDIYNSIVERRLEAKAAGDKSTADTLKIVINGSFGKFGSCYSVLFSPDLLIATTISGQLYLLMLIERLELAGFKVISGNTDGIVTRLKKERYDEFNEIIHQWERDTGFLTEETRYSAYFARDVNNYVAVKSGGGYKSKGCFGDTGISKNPAGRIIYRAVAEHLHTGACVRDTISSCTDVTEFLFVRNVRGGCQTFDKEYVGKVVRWYYAKGEFRPLLYKNNGNKVPNSDGAKPMMELADSLPDDIDYETYIRAAEKILNAWFRKNNQGNFFDML